ncbi:tRNA (adenosine(37)-N6)-threonylcarbamoyltransferase complex ATPase subunit type 1 TsaE [Rubripirellula amarantea]|nr:tRNA (adenosine(37)-N6)-threonylcarbamoyltransferase complex ATPase subunit type 1 TsaE [Rubripirellula amarantea]
MSHQHKIDNVQLHDLPNFATALITNMPASLVIGLVGTLGAGKTTLVQSIAESLGIDASDVTSPTFTLLQSHQTKALRDDTNDDLPHVLHHLDAYRLADEDEFLELGVDELFEESGSWTLIEWADRVEAVMPPGALWIRIEIDDDNDARELILSTRSAKVAQGFLGL